MKISFSSIVIFGFLIPLIGSLCGYSTVYPTKTTIYKPEKVFPGYTIHCVAEPGFARNVVMVDMNGDVVHNWAIGGYSLGCNLEPLPNGNLLTFITLDTADRALVELDWDSNIVWSYRDPQHKKIHHDFQRLENGNTLLLARELRSIPHISSKKIADDYILEIDQNGNVVWDWYTYEHFDEFGFSSEAKQIIYEQGLDWAHTNSIQSLPANSLGDPNFKEGNILVSQRNTSIVFVIDRDTGDVVWRSGPDGGVSLGQHHARLLSSGLVGADRILMFDNGGKSCYPMESRLHSRVIEVDPLNNQILWEYNGQHSGQNLFTFFSPFKSGAQRLPNGNTLICEGNTGRIFEITREKEIVWEYICPVFHWTSKGETNELYRAWRVDINWGQLD